MSNLLAFQNARSFAEKGFHVFPDGKLWGHGFQDHATADLETLDLIHKLDESANWRIRAGRDYGILILDCPRARHFHDLIAALGPLPLTPMSGRPTSGTHRWFLTDSNDPDCELSQRLFDTHALLKTSAPIPGSIHRATGERYRWRDDFSPNDLEFARLPERWLDLLPKTGGIEVTLRPEFTGGGAYNTYSPSL